MTDAIAQKTAAAAEGFVDSLAAEAQDLLVEMLRFQSLGGQEDGVQRFLADWLEARGMAVELVQADSELENDPNYTHHSLDGHHAPNLITRLPFSGGGRSLLLNSHTDIVPAGPEMFDPKVDCSRVTARGAADAKGQVVAWVLAMLAVKQGCKPRATPHRRSTEPPRTAQPPPFAVGLHP